MKLKVFTLRMNPSSGAFDDKQLDDFQLGKDVLEISEHFLVHEKTPTLIMVLRYREIPDGAHSQSDNQRKDWRGELDAQGQRIYDELRIWRGRRAKSEGIPPYLIFNNRELAGLAAKRPTSLAQLQQIDGVGEAKSTRWGEEILALLAKLTQQPENAPLPSPSPAAVDGPRTGGKG